MSDLFRVEKGNWYVHSSDEWGEWAVFFKDNEHPIAICKESANGEQVAKYIVERLNSLPMIDFLDDSKQLAEKLVQIMNEGERKDWKIKEI